MSKKLIPLFVLVVMFGIACQKHTNTKCLKAKVIRGTCAGIVLQVLNNNSVGDDGWVDIFGNNARYDNVFSASNACKIPSEYKVGDVIYVTLGKPAATDCVQCTLYDAPPAAAYEVTSMGNLPCNESTEK